MNCLGIIRESRVDDFRTPLAPKNIEQIKKKYPKIKVIIQPSKLRSFSDDEYQKSGAFINESLNECDIIFGVKEVDPEKLLENKTYVFFSHTYKLNPDTLINAQGTPGMDKKELLRSIIKKKIKLIDYENIRDIKGTRYLGFGRFAGIVGCFNTLNLFLHHNKFLPLGRAYKINNYERIKNILKKIIFPKMKLLVTGDGRVAKGVIELLNETNIKQVSKDDFLKSKIESPIFCNLQTKDYVVHNEKKNFDLLHFIKFPEEYSSCVMPYLKESNVYISAHYWEPGSPKIFNKDQLKEIDKLKIIGDITCDVDGSVPTTIKSTTIENPYFYLDKKTFKEDEDEKDNIAIMAVDNLPSELPRDSSFEFGNGIVKHVIPFLINKDDGRIFNATITKQGLFLDKYNYLDNYINSI